jgi:F-type H+-transporting ATPase subunit gamma
MGQARELKKRMRAVDNIRRITKTMQMIATSKFARAEQRAKATKPYTEGIFGLVTELAQKAGNISHPLIDGPPSGLKPDAKPLVLVLTSDRGLCGPYNGSVIRAAVRRLREYGQGQYALEVVGRKGVGVLKFNNFPIAHHHTIFGDNPKIDDVHRLADGFMERFEAGEVSSVHVVYMRFESTSRQRPEILQLLPLKPPAPDEADQDVNQDANRDGSAGAAAVEYDFSPEPAELLSALLPETVRSTLLQCFLDAVVSEHVARMVAMKAATDNAGKMRKDLGRQFNRARQAQITTELSEIIAGAAAQE